jgi:3-hydroxyisobutyrate dehydrogenase
VAHLSQRFTRMGPSGAGQVTKLCNQIISGGTMVLIAEAVALAERTGVDASRLNEALKGGFADSIPFQLLAPRFASRTYEPPLGQLHTMLKDLDTVSDVARRAGVPAPMTETALALMQRLADAGHGDDDITVLCRLYDDETP